MDSLRGQLLIAAPTLPDPNFQRTVVLLVEHGPEGALGLVLNRASKRTVGEVVPELDGLVDPEDHVFMGGPVQPSGLIVLARFQEPGESALLSFDDVGILRTDGALGDPPSLLETRSFAGHSGWGPGQLDNEIERGDWILEPATLQDAFSKEPEQLWSDVLARKGGSYALVARMPLDPSVN
jgi:putative transcriptional regulator